MALRRLQGTEERQVGVFYEYDTEASPLGEGATGRVFKGWRVIEATGDRAPVAVKCIYDDIPERIIERARREASVKIDHRNLLHMYAFIETFASTINNGMMENRKNYFVIMELLEGVTLDDFLQGKITDQRGNDYEALRELSQRWKDNKSGVVLNIMNGILDGLQALHDAGFLHRDLDPSNIMMTASGGIKIIDFGICKQQNTLNTQDKGLTVSGVFMGKPDYASPELAIGDVVHQNQTTDIYAVGVILFQLCTGHMPFSGANNDILLAHMRKPLPVKDIDIVPLRKVVAKATEKEQGRRYQSAIEFKAEMMKAVMSSRTEHKRDKIIITVLSALLVAVVSVGIWALFARDNDQTVLKETEGTETGQIKMANSLDYASIAKEEPIITEDSILTETMEEPPLTNTEKKVRKKVVKEDVMEVEVSTTETKAEVQAPQPAQEVEVTYVYYIIGTKEELQEKGLLTKGNLFKKKKVDISNADNSMFVKSDMDRLFRIRIPAPAKKVKILTGNRENAYSIEEVDDNNSVLIIRRPKTFWFDSKYLIIRTN